MNRKLAVLVAALALLLVGCSSDADVARNNISREAEQFKVDRRIVFFNGITDKYLLVIEGKCSVETSEGDLGGALQVVCRIADDQYATSFLGLSDNVSYFVEQVEPIDVDVYHYQVIFKPETIAPYIDLETSVDIEGDGGN